MSNIEDLSHEDLQRIIKRDQFVKEQLSARVANLLHENLELMAVLQEIQDNTPEPAASNGEVSPPPQEPEGVIS